MKCRKCGTESKEGGYCPNCGARLMVGAGLKTNHLKSRMSGRTVDFSAKSAPSVPTSAGLKGDLLSAKGHSRVKWSANGENLDYSHGHYSKRYSDKELFKRSPRIQERLPTGKIEIPNPPAEARKPEIDWISTLLPVGVTIAIAIAMALVFQNTTSLFMSVPVAVSGVIISILNYEKGKKEYSISIEERRTTYQQALEKTLDIIKEKRTAQKKAMLLADPSPEACLSTVKSRGTSLWCRDPGDSDFLSVRIGTGTVPLSTVIEQPRVALTEEDELRRIPAEVYYDNITIDRMPIVCDIRKSGVVGVIGTQAETCDQLQNMIFHLATHHCYTEMKLICFCSEEEKDDLLWLAKLPHTRGTKSGEIYLVSTQEMADELFRFYAELFKQRKQSLSETNTYGSAPQFLPYILFVFFEPNLLKKSDPVNQYLFMEHGLGIGCLMAVRSMAQLPKQCTEVIDLTGDEGEMYNTAWASERKRFNPDKISPEYRREFGQEISPLYCDESISGNELPQSYSFYQMLGINAMEEFNIGNGWQNSDLLTSATAPSAPIGVLENGEHIFFNSPPTGDNGGAHALVAGTAGSGKSEALLTLIMSLALKYPPDEVSFLVIDFKGDSLAGKLVGLPHLRGVITNLDGDELRRSLISIGAENIRRQNIFNEYNAKHPEEKKSISSIRDYTEKYREGNVDEPLPHLFIVVDEFAEMKKQLPDIMDQFISTAQVGRSLGMHLILATQSPSGVVDGKIRANTLKQLCLKVANSGESRDVIGSELAARIKDPGRGYLRIDDRTQLFQSAYGSGKLILNDGTESTQIREVLDAISAYCHLHNIRKLPDLFYPPLPKDIPYPAIRNAEKEKCLFGQLPIGLRDDPASQFMGEHSIDAFSRNTLIVGSQLMGKTNLLQVILRGVAERYSVQEVNVYILEFSSFFLKNYEGLAHVGGVVTPQETDKMTNLFRMLKEEVDYRREKFSAIGVTTFMAYRESGTRDLPQIVLVVDDLSAAKAYFSMDNDPLLDLCKNGLSLGISVIATATQAVGGATYLPTFANRIALYNNDSSMYNMLMGRVVLRPKEIPGRCLVAVDNISYECQSFLAFAGKREIDRAEAIRSFCIENTAKANGRKSRPIPYVPNDLSMNRAIAEYPNAYTKDRLMLGLDYATVRPVSVKLAGIGALAVSGNERDVQNFQRYLLSVSEKTTDFCAEYYILDGIDRPLQPLSGYSCVAEYFFLPEQAIQLVKQVRVKAEARYARAAAGDVSALETAPTLVLMLNSNEAINAVSSNKEGLEAWLALMGKLKGMNVCTVFGTLDNVSIPYSSDVLKKFKEDGKLLFFEELTNLKITDLPYGKTKKFAGAFRKGDGYLIAGNEIARIRVPSCPHHMEN